MSELSFPCDHVEHPSTNQRTNNTKSQAQAGDGITSPKDTTCSEVSWSSTDNEDTPPSPPNSSKTQQDQRQNHAEVKHNSQIINNQQHQEPTSIYKCKICNTDLTSLHYSKRVVHVKQCMAGKQKPLPPQQQQQIITQISRPQSDSIDTKAPTIKQGHQCTTMTDDKCTIKPWLRQLGLECYHDICIREEIDLSIVHMITGEEWQEVGVLDRMHQQKLVEAGRKKGGSSSSSIGRHIQAASRQQQDTMLAQDIANNNNNREMHGNADENNNTNGALIIAGHNKTIYYTNSNNNNIIHPTPPMILGHSGTVTAARVAANSTLWTSAATCQPIAPTLEARLTSLKRKNGGDSNSSSREEVELLARGIAPLGPLLHGHGNGGAAITSTKESRASKLQKLQALREEVKCHEDILRDLKSMVNRLESELGFNVN